MKTKTRKRWYDRDKRFADALDRFMKAHPRKSVEIIRRLLDMIKESNPDILGGFTIPDDVDRWTRRWYDKDPTFWLVVNGLKHAPKKLVSSIARYLEKELQ
jgi:hypothetical protein